MRNLLSALALFPVLACSREPTPAPSSTSGPAASPTTAATPNPGDDGVAEEGSPAPDVKATAHDGTEIHLSALKGKPVVLYFYPKDETPGCTKEACAFRDAWGELAKTGVVLVGVSTDSLDSHKKFAENHKLPFHLVSDADGAIARAYGVPKRAGFLARQTFVIGADGKIKKVYRTVDVSGHAAEVLADVKAS